MARFFIRRLGFLALTLLLVSVFVFLVSELAPGDVARNILGQFASPEQVELMREQLGLNQPVYTRYFDWLIGNDWRHNKLVGKPLTFVTVEGQREPQWYAVEEDGTLSQWKWKDDGLVRFSTNPADGSREELPFDEWLTDENGHAYFWGVDTAGHMTLWYQDQEGRETFAAAAGRALAESSGAKYIPLRKGLLRGDPGISTRTGRPVGPTLLRSIRNSFFLAGTAFLVIMPIALLLGLLAGLREGSFLDRTVSIFSLVTTSIPEFASGVFLILVFAFWLDLLPGSAVIADGSPPWQNLDLMILPILTLTLVEVGYVARMTRASMVEVMNAPYIRTAYLKGLPYKRIVFRHALRNALMAPITVIMLHVNWLVGGIVVVESVFGYPGLGRYILDSALFKDVFAIEAAAMVMVALAVSTQLVADIIYTFLNPRIRYT